MPLVVAHPSIRSQSRWPGAEAARDDTAGDDVAMTRSTRAARSPCVAPFAPCHRAETGEVGLIDAPRPGATVLLGWVLPVK